MVMLVSFLCVFPGHQGDSRTNKKCVLKEKKTEKYSLIILKNTVDDNKELLFVSFLFRAFFRVLFLVARAILEQPQNYTLLNREVNSKIIA